MAVIHWLDAAWIDIEVHEHAGTEWLLVKWFGPDRDRHYVRANRFKPDHEEIIDLVRVGPKEAHSTTYGLVVRYNTRGLPCAVRIPDRDTCTKWSYFPPRTIPKSARGTTYINQCDYWGFTEIADAARGGP